MKPQQSASQFQAALEASGSASNLTPRTAFECFLSFYETVEAEGCEEDSGDMLLFQWGTYDWGEGEFFELDFTRQFIELGAEGDDAFSQLHVTFRFPPSPELALVGAGNQWCSTRTEAEEFRGYVEASLAFNAVMDRGGSKVIVSHEYV